MNFQRRTPAASITAAEPMASSMAVPRFGWRSTSATGAPISSSDGTSSRGLPTCSSVSPWK